VKNKSNIGMSGLICLKNHYEQLVECFNEVFYDIYKFYLSKNTVIKKEKLANSFLHIFAN